MLGYFDSEFYELGFHEQLIQAPPATLEAIIRHEVAHYITYILHGPHIQPHGVEFIDVCQRFGWGKEVYRAATHIDLDSSHQAMHSGALRKVQKLMALAASGNSHEAEQAMIKSQQLLLKYNIEGEGTGQEKSEEKFFLKRILKQSKKNAKLQAMAKIVETFFVNIIFSRSQEGIYLEILGSQTNVEIAEYVANFLHLELEKMWVQVKRQHPELKGLVAKNSFFLGIAKGYCYKINFLKKAYDLHTSQALVIIENKLEEAVSLAYRQLRRSKSSRQCCLESAALGEQMGRQLSINPAINHAASCLGNLIGYRP